MDSNEFLLLAEWLTGSPVKEVTEVDRGLLDSLLWDNDKKISFSEFNELLLLVNKDRVERPFYSRYFEENNNVRDIKNGVALFQKEAMLCMGNFIHAFRTLSRLQTQEDLRRALGQWGRDPGIEVQEYTNRNLALIEIEKVDKHETYLVGYLSAKEIDTELKLVGHLKKALDATKKAGEYTLDNYKITISATRQDLVERRQLFDIIDKYYTLNNGDFSNWTKYVADCESALSQKKENQLKVRAIAAKHQDVYLTWDYMDVYFATSMRKKWEYEELYKFIQSLMSRKELKDLNLRYFDPTQAFTDNRVDKGLVEALMLKRAKCTVYSVQDTDTLGKDSELAATLAQGKPVIAYVPEIDVDERARRLATEDPGTILERGRFIVYADENLERHLSEEDWSFFQPHISSLAEFQRSRIWQSLPDENKIGAFRETNKDHLSALCKIIAGAEKRIYDKRADTLANSHPLGIQVNLASGVANGVLVARTLEKCSKILVGVLTNTLKFHLEDSQEHNMCYLVEEISKCPYRVVSKNRKLTNCFWNFYHRSN